MHRFILVFSAVLALFLSIPALAGGGYAAISFSKNTGQWGSSWNNDNEQSARRTAQVFCSVIDCKSVVYVHNGYAALASNPRHDMGVGWAPTKEEAIELALGACSKLGPGCVWNAWVYSFDENTDDTLTYTNDLGQVSLEEVGGPFHHTIPGFKGFVQLRPNWCWAATAQTIYYQMTGATLDQRRIARIHDDGATGTGPFVQSNRAVDPLNCDQANNQADEACDHKGDPETVFKTINLAIPDFEHPENSDLAKSLVAIRKSLEKNIPVGIQIAWTDTSFHLLTVFGATYEAKPDGSADVSFQVFDSTDGKARILRSYLYQPSYRSRPGPWTGRVSLVDYNRRAEVDTVVCEFLTDTDHEKFCK